MLVVVCHTLTLLPSVTFIFAAGDVDIVPSDSLLRPLGIRDVYYLVLLKDVFFILSELPLFLLSHYCIVSLLSL